MIIKVRSDEKYPYHEFSEHEDSSFWQDDYIEVSDKQHARLTQLRKKARAYQWYLSRLIQASSKLDGTQDLFEKTPVRVCLDCGESFSFSHDCPKRR